MKRKNRIISAVLVLTMMFGLFFGAAINRLNTLAAEEPTVVNALGQTVKFSEGYVMTDNDIPMRPGKAGCPRNETYEYGEGFCGKMFFVRPDKWDLLAAPEECGDYLTLNADIMEEWMDEKGTDKFYFYDWMFENHPEYVFPLISETDKKFGIYTMSDFCKVFPGWC